MATTASPGAHHRPTKAVALTTLAVALLAAAVLALIFTVTTGSSTEPSTDPAPVVQAEATTTPQAPNRDQTLNPNGPGAIATEHSTGATP